MRRLTLLSSVPMALLALATTLFADDLGPHVVRDTATPCLNFRETASAAAESKACLPPRTTVTVLEAIPFWRKARLEDGRELWAAKKYLEPVAAPVVVPAPSTIPANAWLEVQFIDVGQGDGIWIRTFDDGIDGNGIFEGRNIVIDGGPSSSAGEQAIWQYIAQKSHPGAIIDALILTHPHDDHYKGAETILSHFEVAKYYDPGYPKDAGDPNKAYPTFLRKALAETIGTQPSKIMVGRDTFDQLDWGKELTAEILYSYPGDPNGLGSGNTLENNASIVVKLTYGDKSFLFMGDGEGKNNHGPADPALYVEKVLLNTVPAEKLKATVLKVGHHGSETSSTTPFINAVDPQIVVVSSGRKNFKGSGAADVFLPQDSTLRRYCCHNPAIRIYRTDQNDAAEGRTTSNDADGDNIVIRTNGTDLQVQAFENGQPFTVLSCQPACGN